MKREDFRSRKQKENTNIYLFIFIYKTLITKVVVFIFV